MAVFISYDKKDAAAFSSICLALEGQRIEYLDVKKTIKVEELQDAIAKSVECCLFLATKNSTVNAESWVKLGVFWVLGIRIFIFSDADLTEDQIPLQFQDMITRDLRQLISELKKEISEVREKRSLEAKKKAEELLQAPKLVSHLTIDVFNNFISSAIQSKESLVNLIILLREAFPDRVGEDNSQPLFDNTDLLGFALPLLKNLVGKPQEEVQPLAKRFFGHSFQFTSSSGEEYCGFALERSYFQIAYENCLLIHFQNSSVDAAFLSSGVGISSDQDGNSFYYYEPIICSSGSNEIGEISEIKQCDYSFREGSIPFFGG